MRNLLLSRNHNGRLDIFASALALFGLLFVRCPSSACQPLGEHLLRFSALRGHKKVIERRVRFVGSAADWRQPCAKAPWASNGIVSSNGSLMIGSPMRQTISVNPVGCP